jgi:hypothetical protein
VYAKHDHVYELLKPGPDKYIPIPDAEINRMNLIEVRCNLVQNLLKDTVGFLIPLRLGINQRK